MVDPLAEKYYDVSPYAYCNDNFVKYIDPNGKGLKLAEVYTKEFAKAVTFMSEKGTAKNIVGL